MAIRSIFASKNEIKWTGASSLSFPLLSKLSNKREKYLLPIYYKRNSFFYHLFFYIKCCSIKKTAQFNPVIFSTPALSLRKTTSPISSLGWIAIHNTPLVSTVKMSYLPRYANGSFYIPLYSLSLLHFAVMFFPKILLILITFFINVTFLRRHL